MYKKNPCSFAAFMSYALYDPAIGYYTGSQPKIGAQGDFITAPEISPVFGKCIATQCEQILKDLSGGVILEIGAGLGTLAADILETLEQKNTLPNAYWILEISPWLRAKQYETLQKRVPHLLNRMVWLEKPPQDSFEGIILGNEVIDALPVHRFIVHQNQMKEYGVIQQDSAYHWIMLDNTLEQPKLGLPEGYISEIALDLHRWIYTHTQALSKGVVLWVDYGYAQKEYYAPYRSDGTLRCHYQHQAHDNPFIHVGQQDITSHVNFTQLAEAGIAAGFELAGYCAQAPFLASLGILEYAAKLPAEKAFALRRLIDPALMGDLFKAMAFQKNYETPLLGFQLHSATHTL